VAAWVSRNAYTADCGRAEAEEKKPAKSTLAGACAATTVFTVIVGFSWGGWAAGGTSRDMATAAGQVARGELAAVIRIGRFKAATNSVARYSERTAITDTYKRRQFIEAGG
jgi:hypothetical protein